jgi:uncharacterized membrane protein YkvA (DUF1232 family)
LEIWGKVEMMIVVNQPLDRQPSMKLPIQAIYNWYRGLLQHPKYRWWVVAASLTYLVSPIDIAPDMIPFIGWIDDATIVSILVAEAAQIAKTTLQAKNKRSNLVTDSSNAIEVEAVS